MTRISFNALLFILFFAVSQLSGQIPANPDSALQEILRALKGEPLHLEQGVQFALRNATSVRKAEASYLAAGGAMRKESGNFDPRIFFNLNYLDQQQPTASFFAGAPVLSTQQTTSRSGLRMSLPIGTELELSVNTVRLQTNSAFAFLNPEYDAFGTLSLRQPLLGGLTASARKQLTKAEREFEAAKARYEQQVLAVRTELERTYWDLYVSERDYAVQKLTRDRATAFLTETEVRAQTGRIGPNQVANAKAFLAQQELQLIEREEHFDQQSDRLASLIGARPSTGMSRFVPVDEPPSNYSVDPVEVLVEQAMKKNLDLIAAQRDVDAARSLANAAGWESLPNVNLVGSLGGNGLSGAARDVISFNGDTLRTGRGGSFGDALTQVTRREFPNWSVGVEVSIPIGLRIGLGEKDRLEAELLKAEQNYVEKSRMLADQVRATHRELVHGQGRLEAARQGVEAAQEQMRIGLIEFRNGRSTAFELVHLSEDFAVAQQRYSEALVRTAKAAATLKQLTSGEYSGSKTP